MVRELLAVWVAVAALAVRASAEPALPETQLPLRLIGTVVAAQSERSIAVIENLGATKVVRTGDAIGAARIQAIHTDEIVLAQAGRLERLALAPVAIARAAGTEQTSAAGSPGGDANTVAGEETDRGSRQAPEARRVRTAPRLRATRTSAVPASAARDQDGEAGSKVTQQVGNDQLLVSLASQARYAPMLDGDGQIHGVAIMDVRPDSTLERLGLRSGDVVVSVGGVPVDSSSKAFNALRALNPSAGGEVMVERGGLPTRITVPPGAF